MINPIDSANNELKSELVALAQKFGSRALLDGVRQLVEDRPNKKTLTIVCNLGPHPLPDEIIRGELFVASKGNLDFSSPQKVRESIDEVLAGVITKVRSQHWSEIYVVPFGHVTLAMQIKILCYRILGIETIDWFYLGAIGYFPLQISTRELILSFEGKT